MITLPRVARHAILSKLWIRAVAITPVMLPSLASACQNALSAKRVDGSPLAAVRAHLRAGACEVSADGQRVPAGIRFRARAAMGAYAMHSGRLGCAPCRRRWPPHPGAA